MGVFFKQAQAYDYFQRNLVDADTWGTSYSGHVWRPVSDERFLTTDSGVAQIDYVGIGESPSLVDLTLDEAAAWQRAIARFPYVFGMGYGEYGLALRTNVDDPGGSGYVFARIQRLPPEGSVYNLVIGKVVGGSESILASTATAVNNDQPVWLVFDVDQVAGLRAKVIHGDDDEVPTTWTLTASLPDDINEQGYAGIAYKGHPLASLTLNVNRFWYFDTSFGEVENTGSDGIEDLPDTDTREFLDGEFDSCWGVSTSGHVWEGPAAGITWFHDDPDFGISPEFDRGTTLHISSDANKAYWGVIGPSSENHYVTAGIETIGGSGPSTQNLVAVMARVTYTTPPGGGPPVLAGGYRAQIRNGLDICRVEKYVAGSWTLIGSYDFGAAYNRANKYNIRLSCNGTSIGAKVWAGDIETGPNLDVVYADATYTSGQCGLLFNPQTASAGGATFDSFHNSLNGAGTTDIREELDVAIEAVDVTDVAATLRANYRGDTDDDNTVGWSYKKSSDQAWTSFAGTGTRNNGGTPKYWEHTITGLDYDEYYDFRVVYADADGVRFPVPYYLRNVRTGFDFTHDVTLDLSSLGNDFTAVAAYVGDANLDNSAVLEYRELGSGVWLDGGAMVADRATNTFSATVSDLLVSTTYEARVTFTDPDNSPTTLTTAVETIVTTGTEVRALSVEAIPSEISVVLKAHYTYDTSEVSSASIQYRDVRQRSWTTIPSSDVTVDREEQAFTAVVSGLSPTTSYEALATFSSPNGFSVGTSPTVQAVFTTKGSEFELDLRTKHYLYKVYDPDGAYITTWREQGDPRFREQENGGVADLNVTLPRRLAEVERDPSIDFVNRVDVWAVDYQCDGMGRNLVLDSDFDLGSWVLPHETNTVIAPRGGPDESAALKITATGGATWPVLSAFVPITSADGAALLVPYVFTAFAKAAGGKAQLYVECYDDDDVKIGTSDDVAQLYSVGPEWQRLRMVYTPIEGTTKVRVGIKNDGNGTFFVDKVAMRPQELMIYRGKIETYKLQANAEGQNVEVQILGLSSALSDDYIDFLQYTTAQNQPDRDRQNPAHLTARRDPTDPGQMLRDIIDQAKAQNPRLDIYYTADSIRNTGDIVEYTFRDQLVRACFDKVRALCPSGWYYRVEPDGLVILRGPDESTTHTLRLNVEILSYENNRTITGLKNFIKLKGRQDEDRSEIDQFGTINYIAHDPQSIDRYGRRMTMLRDANVKDPNTAEVVAEGRLEEQNKVEQRALLFVPDEKDLRFASNALRGANIEEFRPGDMVQVIDPLSDPSHLRSWWDEFVWDEDNWDDTGERIFPEAVPIRGIHYAGTHVELELSERPPSASGSFARLLQLQQRQEALGFDDDR